MEVQSLGFAAFNPTYEVDIDLLDLHYSRSESDNCVYIGSEARLEITENGNYVGLR